MIRKVVREDYDSLATLINSINIFNEEEKKVAVELIYESIFNDEQDYYNTYVFVEKNIILGYHCIGKRSLTDAVYDLYWIVVSPSVQSKGVGQKLLEHAENFVRDKGGRWVLAETSSSENYFRTRNFYLRNNYTIVSQINDFYKMNDNLIVFGKYLNNTKEP